MSHSGDAPPGPDLASLIEAETRLDELLARARAEADELVDAARAEVAQASERMAAALAAVREQVAAEIDGRTRSRLRDLDAAGADELARYRELAGAELAATAARLARRLAEQLLAEVDR